MRDRRSMQGIHAGFTLVELLVVVSIIALLVAILLPSLRKAREQTKRAVCASNLAQLGKAMIGYGLESDSFPIILSEKDGGYTWNTWSYGGWTGRNPYWASGNGIHHFDSDQRPLNRYMFSLRGGLRGCGGDPSQPHQPPGESTPLPVYKCPSDTVELRNLYEPTGAGQALHQFNSYDDVGTSYRLNYHWSTQALGQVRSECPGCPVNVETYRKMAETGQAYWKRYLLRGAARFVILTEQPANLGFFRKIQTLGFHKKFSWHNYAFLDGHVEYLETDTRRFSGRDWTVENEYLPRDTDTQTP